MAEFAKPNREAVNKWLNKEEGPFDWSHFLQFVADLEKSRYVDGYGYLFQIIFCKSRFHIQKL